MIGILDRRTGRRTVLKALVAGIGAGAMPLFGADARADSFAGTTMRLGTWGGSWRDNIAKIIAPKVETQGAKVDYVLDTPAGNVAKLIAARGRDAPLDGLEGAPDLLPSLISAGLIQKLDYAALPNAKPLPAFARSEYAMVTVATWDGIVYNTAKFRENQIAVPTHYSQLDDPKLAGRVAFPDITHTQHWNCVVGLAYDAGGDEATLEKAIPLINKIKPAYFYTSSTELSTKFGSGEIWAAPWHAGFVVRLRRTGLPVSIAYQKIGNKYGALFPTLYYISKTTKNAALAEAFLNGYLDPDVQFEFTRATGTFPMNPQARGRLKDDPENKDVLLFSDAEVNNALFVDYARIDLPKWHEAWSRDVQRS